MPKAQVGDKLAFVVIELGVALIGLGLFVQRTIAHVLHAQRTGDDQHLLEGATITRLEQHAAHARIERQPGQPLANRRELVEVVNGAQLAKQLVAVGDGAPLGRLDEGKVFDTAQTQGLHAQNHRGQRTAQDLRVGKGRAALEVLLLVQANTNALGHPAAAPGPLVGRRLRDRLDQQLFDLAAKAVALDAGGAAVDHKADPGHRQRSLGHIGGQHDAPAAVGLKNTVLLGLRQPRKQRQHLGRAQHRLVCQVLAQMVGRLTDFTLAGQEDQDVARVRAAAPELVDRIGQRVIEVMVTRLLEGAVTHLHREGAARDHDHRCRALATGKVVGKALRIDRCRGDDQLQIGPARQQLAQVAQQKIDVQAALVCLVDDQAVVGPKERIGLGFGQQNAVGHELDRGTRGQPVLKAHLVAHHLAQRGFKLVGDALGHAGGGDAARLCVADQVAALARMVDAAPAHAQQDLGQLRGLARAGFATHDDHLMARDGAGNVLAPGRNGQALRKLQVQRNGKRRCGSQGTNAAARRQASKGGRPGGGNLGQNRLHQPRTH